jgi:histidine triad (HIT) family protein
MNRRGNFLLSAEILLGNIIAGLLLSRFRKLVPVKKVKETDRSFSFYHPKPSYRHHIVIIPKKAIRSFSRISKGDFDYIEDMMKLAQEIVKEKGWERSDCRMIINGGSNQKVNQLHLHLISGKKKVR